MNMNLFRRPWFFSILDLDRKGTLQYATVEILSKPPAPQSRGMTAPVLREDDAAIRWVSRL